MLTSASELAHKLHVEPKFPEVTSSRIRKIPTKFDYEGKDEPILDPKATLKINFYFCIIDQALSLIITRFKALKLYNDIYWIYV